MDEAAKIAPTPRGTRIETSIDINAQPAAIWALIADVNGWSRWNPLYEKASGSIGLGDRIDLSVVLPGMKGQPAKSFVKWVEPGARIDFTSVNSGGLVLGNRYVIITPAGDGRSHVVNGEIMGGPLGPLIAMLVGKKVRQALEGMNAALKAEAEKAV